MGVRGGRWLSVVVLDTEPPAVVVVPVLALGDAVVSGMDDRAGGGCGSLTLAGPVARA